MSKSIKQVYSTLKIDDGRLEILTAEYFNSRFNIINVYSATINGVVDYKITDKKAVLDCLYQGIEEVSSKVGARLEKVILVLPPFNFKRVSLRVSVIPNDGILKKSDIARAITNALKTDIGDNLIVVNTLISKYSINGISSRRFPENESCDEALVDIDLLCADKEMTYSYVKAINDVGLEILDLTLNNYAIAKESVLFEDSINQNTILLDVENDVTYLSLLSKGKLISSEVIYDGMNNLYDAVYKEYHFPLDIIPRLVTYNVDFSSNHPDDSIFAWNNGDLSYSLTIKELTDFIQRPLDTYVEKIVTMCRPIIDQGVNFRVCGKGSNMNALLERLSDLSMCNVKGYFPDAIGVRNTSLCAVYGALYVYKEKAEMNNISVNCVNIQDYDKSLDKLEVNVEGETITSKIKNFFEIYKDREDI